MAWEILFEKRAQKELRAVSRSGQIRILSFLHQRVARRDSPREVGQSLTGKFTGFWKYRVGDYRIIARIDDRVMVITVVQVGHRREIYR